MPATRHALSPDELLYAATLENSAEAKKAIYKTIRRDLRQRLPGLQQPGRAGLYNEGDEATAKK
jgi:hypothetical protein